jgi:hypothetical protein
VPHVNNPRFYRHWSHRVNEDNVFGYTEAEIDQINAAGRVNERMAIELAIMDERIRLEEIRTRDECRVSDMEDDFGLKGLNKMKMQIRKNYRCYE